MDTRSKIVEGAECAARLEQCKAARPGLRVVSGFFDPLLAWHAERLAAARNGASALAVVVLEPPQPILSARARAELVAALAAVDLVLLPSGQAAAAAEIRIEDEDLARRAAFIEHVRERQS